MGKLWNWLDGRKTYLFATAFAVLRIAATHGLDVPAWLEAGVALAAVCSLRAGAKKAQQAGHTAAEAAEAAAAAARGGIAETAESVGAVLEALEKASAADKN